MMKGFIKRLRYGEMRFRRTFRRGEKGFTLMELLIVVAVLGVLAAVLVPRLTTFFSTGQVAAANTEVANVEVAAMAYYADNNGTWPTDTNDLVADSLMAPIQYLNKEAVYNYGFDLDGKVGGLTGTEPATGDAWPNDGNVLWNADDHKWEK